MKPGGVVVLVVSVAIFFGGIVVGLNLLTQEGQVTSSAPTCEMRTVHEGEELTPNLVHVNVYNASRTAGLADRVSRLLQQRNFLPGTIANNPTDITTNDVVIIAADDEDPRVKLVAGQFIGKVTVQPGDIAGTEGISVLIGRNYAEKGLNKKAIDKVESDRTISSCIPYAPDL